MQENTTGQSWPRSGKILLRAKTCKSCGCRFYGSDEVCEDCWTEYHTLIVDNCMIEESEGRCDEYYKGTCEKCLDITAALDWKGWKRVKYVNKNKH